MNSVSRSELLDSFLSYSDDYDRHLTAGGSLSTSLGELLEDLETSDSERQRKAVGQIVGALLDEAQRAEDSVCPTAARLLATGALPLLLSFAKMKAMEARSVADHHLQLELEIRGVSTALFLTLLLGPAEEVRTEVEALVGTFEEVFLALVKLSLEKTFIPMKKVCVLLYYYLTLVLPPHEATQESHLKLTKTMIQQVTQLPPRYKTPPENATELFYVSPRQRRLMTKENPLPQVLVVGLLRAMLAACPGSPSQQQGLSVNREWQSPILFSRANPTLFAGYSAPFPCDCEECTEEKHKIESARHKLILVHYITLLLDLLIVRFKSNHTLQLSTLTQQIYDANGVLVMLKFMNQDFSTLPEIQTAALKGLTSGYIKGMIERTLLGMMRTCYCIVKPYPERIESNMIQYKAPLIMKRLYSKVEDERVQLAALKLIKLQVKYQPRKWKTYPANLRFISAIYQRLPPAKSDWLNGSVDKTDIMTQEEIRQLNIEFNYHNYWQIFDRKDSTADEDLSEDFKQNYEDWLQEHVWGYYE